MIAALYVEKGGCYDGLPDVELWDRERDARLYAGPWPVVAHPPCERWGRYWHGSPRKPHQYRLGDDGGCFAAALASLRAWGGVLEHPAHSHAWKAFDLPRPTPGAGWQTTLIDDLWTCHVEQGHYAHIARKATWLLACRVPALPVMDWSAGEQRLPQIALERYGYERARRTGVMAYIGGKDKAKLRARTPHPFRDLLLAMARSVGE